MDLSSEFVECYIMHVTFQWIWHSLAELKDQWEKVRSDLKRPTCSCLKSEC